MPRGERLALAHVAVRLIATARSQLLVDTADYLFQLFDQISVEFGSRAAGMPDGFDSAAPGAVRKALLDRASELIQFLPKRRATGLDRRIEWLAGIVGISTVELEILRHLTRAKLFAPYCELLGNLSQGSLANGEVNLDALSELAGRNALTVRRKLEPTSTLLATGLVRDRRAGDYEASDFVIRIANMRSVQPEILARNFLVPARPSTLQWYDFEHLGLLRDLSRQVVFQAARRKVGINILLYGVPGTGKSEFARALAEACGLTAVLVGSADDDGDEPDRSDRLGHLAICRSLVGKSGSHLLIVDEADDLMIRRSFSSDCQSKLYLNSLIERTTSPTVWIVNDRDVLGAPVVRRMGLALEFPLPGPAVRKRIVARIAAVQKLRFADSEIEQIAKIEAAPAVFENALRAARWTSQSAETTCLVANSIQRALGKRPPVAMADAAEFDPELCVSDVDLSALAGRLIKAGASAWSLLASGPPGTGKSAFARYIAKRAGIRVIEKKASDILDMYVGNTEKLIAQAFEEAADSGAMLIMDEADSLLRNRELARQSWEASMTNEMLTWMERSPVPFVATTNLRNCLDPATARRFLFKIELSDLDARRAARLFGSFFGMAAPARLEKLVGLTPGDFALVARKSALLGESRAEALVALLEHELRAKPDANRKPLGF